MSNRTRVPVSTPGMSSEKRPSSRLSRLIKALARIPLPVVGIMLVLGAVLSDLINFVMRATAAAGTEEIPHWVARLTFMQYNLLLPIALIALWARRRKTQGRVGTVGAVLIAFLPVVHLFFTVCAVIWELILGHGDITYPFAYIEFLILPAYLGVLIASVAWMRDRSAAGLIGPLIVAGVVLHFFIPWAFTVVYAALAFVIIRTSLVRKDAAVSPSDVS